jgi:hypothetical protein
VSTFSEHDLVAILPGVTYVVVPGYTTTYPTEVFYTEGFETSLDSWAGLNVTRSTTLKRTGSYAMRVVNNDTAGPTDGFAKRTLTGLMVGRLYTVECWAAVTAGSASTSFGVTGKTTINKTLNVANLFVNYTTSFTASATSHEVFFQTGGTSGGPGSYVDDIKVTALGTTITTPPVTDTDFPLNVTSANVTLDSANIPYARVELECAIPTEDVLEQIDPYEDLRVEITLGQSFAMWNAGGYRADQLRTFDLTVAARDVDYNDGTLSITAGSDEFLLQTYSLVSALEEVVPDLSVKDGVTYALAKIGATLAPGAADGTLENTDPLTIATNLIPDPKPALATTWSNGTGASAAAMVATPASPLGFATVLRYTAAAGVANRYINVSGSGPAVAPGDVVTVSFYARSSVARSATANIQFLTDANVALTTTTSTAVVTSTTAWTRYTVTATAPATAAKVNGWMATAGNASGNFHYMSGAMITKTATALPYFDGDTVDSGLNYYEWAGDVSASASVHLYQANNAMTWEPGTTAWSFVDPLVQATGLRLWADEHRVWHLDSSDASVEGLVSLGEGENVTQASDTISVLDDSDYVEGVVVEYRWTDTLTGLEKVQRDVAGTSGKALLVQHNRPYPGPGAAQAILDRAKGKGRTFSVEAMSNYEATPGKAVTIELPSSPVQLGRITAVTWSIPDAHMTVATKGLTDIPDTAWILAPSGRTWATAPGTWTTYTN